MHSACRCYIGGNRTKPKFVMVGGSCTSWGCLFQGAPRSGLRSFKNSSEHVTACFFRFVRGRPAARNTAEDNPLFVCFRSRNENEKGLQSTPSCIENDGLRFGNAQSQRQGSFIDVASIRS